MTSPNTNIEKQKRRHWPVLTGIIGAIILVIIAVIAFSPANEQAPEPAAAASDG